MTAPARCSPRAPSAERGRQRREQSARRARPLRVPAGKAAPLLLPGGRPGHRLWDR